MVRVGTRMTLLLGAAAIFAGTAMAQQVPSTGTTPPQNPGMSPAQSQQQQTMQQMENLQPNQETGSSGLSGPEMRDRAFLRQAYSDGLAEIQLAKLALEKSSNSDVKGYAQTMVDDHTALNERLAPLAQTSGVTLVKRLEKNDQAEYDKLKDLSGDAFDKEYAVYMVTSHRVAQHSYRVEVSVAPQTNGLRQEVATDLITIHKHAQEAQKLAEAVGATVPPRTPPTK